MTIDQHRQRIRQLELRLHIADYGMGMGTSKREQTMTPTKYELLIENGVICLRGYSPQTAKGYFNVEAVKNITGKSLPKLRQQGAKLAKHFGVKFEDRT
jgi:hypothetical protein